MMGCGTAKLSKLHHEEPKGKQNIHKTGTGCYKEVQVKNKKKGGTLKNYCEKIIIIQLRYKLAEISEKVEQKGEEKREEGDQKRYILREHRRSNN